MTYVIAEPCIDIKDYSCVEVCPVDCIHPTKDEPGFADARQLFIDPAECIDCDACVEACPVDAIFAQDQLPDEWKRGSTTPRSTPTTTRTRRFDQPTECRSRVKGAADDAPRVRHTSAPAIAQQQSRR
jgi:ferredoxin